ncbi:MAG TPA: NADP-dependent oxidoreductase [Candidatus Lumbricidophila sp.]|nr:NADP-dependent oxidoreductase [Candidatus Lumbricidophila sp.]
MPRAIQYAELGGPEVMHLIEVPPLTPGPDQVVVQNMAIGVNPFDTKWRAGIRPGALDKGPRIPGGDSAGRITAVGSDVTGWHVGDEVIVGNGRGTYADEVLVAAKHLTAKPAELGWNEAAALPVPAGTAYQAVCSLDVNGGDVLLVHGASGAVGQAVVQFALAAGARVIATAGPHNQARVAELGATPVVYGPGLADRVREVAPEGVTVALDCAGSDEALDVSLELVADRSRIGTIVRGADADRLGIRAWAGGSTQPMTEAEHRWRYEGCGAAAELAASGEFSIEIAKVLPLTEAVQAHQLVEAGALRGKVILKP